MKSMVGQLNDSSRDVECLRTRYSRRASTSCVLAYCSAGDGCGQKNGMTRANEESKLRSKGKSARSLGTKSRHAGGTNGDVFRLSTWYDRTAAAVSVDTLVELTTTTFGVCRCGMPGRRRWCRGRRIGHHAGFTVVDVCRLLARHGKTAAVVL